MIRNLSHMISPSLFERTFVNTDGTVVGWIDRKLNLVSGEYPEIAGYTLAYHCSRLDGAPTEKVSRAVATRLAGQVMSGTWGPRPGRDRVPYTFDIAIAASGLLKIGTQLSLGNALTAARYAYEYIVEQYRREGSLAAIYPSAALASVGDRGLRWSTHGLAHLVKCVQPILLAEINSDGGDFQTAHKLIEWSLLNFDDPRSFAVGGVLSLHAAAYAAEGFAMYGLSTGSSICVQRAIDITRFIAGFRLDSGLVPGFVGPAADLQVRGAAAGQTDVTAQLLRLETLLQLCTPATSKSASALNALLREYGGLMLYRPNSGDQHLNSWATIFAQQALALHGGAELDTPLSLI